MLPFAAGQGSILRLSASMFTLTLSQLGGVHADVDSVSTGARRHPYGQAGLVRPGKSGGFYICELLASLPDSIIS
jgi:hypothetical protein